MTEAPYPRGPLPQSAPDEAVGMPAGEFTTRFGASCRTNHLVAMPVRRRAWLRLGWSLARGEVPLVDRRVHALPDSSELPREFIRLDPWEANYLYLVASLAQKGIVEIGRLRGGSTFLLACANASVPIWSVDIEPRHDGTLRELFDAKGVGDNVELLVGNSQTDPFPEIGEFDVLFIDGNHSYAGCSGDLDAFVPRLAPDGHLVLHDCYGGQPVQTAVLDFLSAQPMEVVRSPYIPSAHWYTSYGSMAHLQKPQDVVAGEPDQRPATIDEVAERRTRRSRLPAAIAAAVAAIVMIVVLLPEALGDWPYDPRPVGRFTHAHHVRPDVTRPPGTAGLRDRSALS